jgi:hypothetical protein
MKVTKKEMREMINRGAEECRNNASAVFCESYTDSSNGMLARTIIAMGASVIDALNTIALILCEMLPDGGAEDG